MSPETQLAYSGHAAGNNWATMGESALLAPDFDAMPAALIELNQWVAWVVGWLPEKGRYNKIPINARTGEAAKSTDPATWSRFAEAQTSYGKLIVIDTVYYT